MNRLSVKLAMCCNRQCVGPCAFPKKAAHTRRRPRSHRDASSQHGSLMQEARGTPSPMPTHSFSASPWHRHQLTGSFVCANCAAPMSLCVVYSIHGLVALLLRFSVGRSGFDLSVSGRPPTSSEAAGPLEKKQNKHCFLAVTPPLSTWWVDQARRRRKFYGGTTLKITFSILLAD